MLRSVLIGRSGDFDGHPTHRLHGGDRRVDFTLEAYLIEFPSERDSTLWLIAQNHGRTTPGIEENRMVGAHRYGRFLFITVFGHHTVFIDNIRVALP